MKTWGQSPIFDPDDRNPKSRALRSAGTALAVLAVAAIWMYSFMSPVPKGDGTVYVGKLREEFQKISPPQGTAATDRLTIHAKSSSALVENRYASQLPIESVLGSYKQQLAGNGWTYSGRFQGGSNWGDNYCKGEFGAAVEVMPAEGSFVFSMSWNGATVHDCSRKTQNG